MNHLNLLTLSFSRQFHGPMRLLPGIKKDMSVTRRSGIWDITLIIQGIKINASDDVYTTGQSLGPFMLSQA